MVFRVEKTEKREMVLRARIFASIPVLVLLLGYPLTYAFAGEYPGSRVPGQYNIVYILALLINKISTDI